MPQDTGEQARDRVAREANSLRASLPLDPTGTSIAASALTSDVLNRLATLGGGHLGGVLLIVTPRLMSGVQPLDEAPGRDDQMIVIALRRVAQSIRKGDLVCRVSGNELMCILPGTGPLEARSVGRRLAGDVAGNEFWHADTQMTIACEMGLASRASGAGGYEVAAMIESARRTILK